MVKSAFHVDWRRNIDILRSYLQQISNDNLSRTSTNFAEMVTITFRVITQIKTNKSQQIHNYTEYSPLMLITNINRDPVTMCFKRLDLKDVALQ